ncbi:hypothetical protein Fleli_3563 [Bernardetia litoralis DSM 6794]|uniref:Uncharacterized protein n=1 Tax=Bernardetia litoralis (strain ATCC 23117 / DSM 6794 / NBRC 15988 / NCIMB 1366 / Fx l1 / Sio-4) TaxID=880071 RepID=I4APJ7_BERLS|nr:hypothetical protein [Bernardetia litoralis]AFM05882.1 hypothetical protein Fleli_3563 [Bernardetia litoralis DSM 6794]
MAEIKIERKKTIIPWLLGLLLLAAVIGGVYFAFYYSNNAESEVMADEVVPNEILPVEENTEANNLPTAVDDFIIFANEESPYQDGEMEIHHKYTSDAIRKMSAALVAIADKKGMADQMNVQDLSAKLNADADEIQKNWKSTDHADHIKQAFLQISGAVNQLSDGSSENLRKEANDIDPNKLTLEQKADVKDFIDKTASVMKQLATI